MQQTTSSRYKTISTHGVFGHLVVHVLGNKSIQRSTALAAILVSGALLFLTFSAVPTAAQDSRSDSLAYELAVPSLIEPECDVAGLFAVKFCDPVENYNRATIEVHTNGTVDPTVGGTYTIISNNGQQLDQGDFCGQTTVGIAPAADQIIVDVASLSSLATNAMEGNLCSVGLSDGEVWLTLSHVETSPPVPEEEEKCPEDHE